MHEWVVSNETKVELAAFPLTILNVLRRPLADLLEVRQHIEDLRAHAAPLKFWQCSTPHPPTPTPRSRGAQRLELFTVTVAHIRLMKTKIWTTRKWSYSIQCNFSLGQLHRSIPEEALWHEYHLRSLQKESEGTHRQSARSSAETGATASRPLCKGPAN